MKEPTGHGNQNAQKEGYQDRDDDVNRDFCVFFIFILLEDEHKFSFLNKLLSNNSGNHRLVSRCRT